MSKKKKFECSGCGKNVSVEIARHSNAVEGKYCSIECYVEALRKVWPRELKNGKTKKSGRQAGGSKNG